MTRISLRKKLALGSAALLLAVTGLLVFALAPAALAQGTPISGTWTITQIGTGSGTFSGFALTGGSFTCTVAFAGDISGTATGTFVYDPNASEFAAGTAAFSGNMTFGGSTYNATYLFEGTVSNIAFATFPPPDGVPTGFTFTPVGEGSGGTDAGQAVDIWGYGTATGSGSGTITINYGAGAFTVANVSASGTWSGKQFGLTDDPVISNVTAGTGGSATVSVSGTPVADVVWTNVNLSGAIGLAEYTGNPAGTPPAAPLGIYIEVSSSVDPGDYAYGACNGIYLRVYYTDAQVAAAGIPESSLIMYRWNGSNWVPIANSGVDTTQNYVWACLTSLSPIAPMQAPAAAAGVPVFPTVFGGIAAAVAAGFVAFALRRRIFS